MTAESVQTEPASSERVTPYAWYALALLSLSFMLASVDRSLVSVVIEPIRAEFGLNDSQLGFLAGLAFSIPFGLASIPFGMLIDRVHRRNLLAAMLLVWSTLTAVCGFAQNYLQLIAMRMTVGASEASFPAAHSMITDYFPVKKRPMAMGLFISGGALAFVLTFALGGWIAQEWGWRAVFFVAGPPGILLALVMFLTLREPLRGGMEANREAVDETPVSLGQTLAYLFSRRPFVHLFFGYALTAAATAGFWSWISSLLIRVHGLPVAHAGLYIAAGAGGCGFLGALMGAAIAGKLGARGQSHVLTFTAGTSLLLAPLGIAMSLAPSLTGALALMTAVGVVKSCYPGPTQGLLLSQAKTRMRGVAAAMLNVAGTLLGFGLGPLIAGTISLLMGGGQAIRYGLAALFLLNIWAAVHFWAARRTLRAEEQLEAQSAPDAKTPSATPFEDRSRVTP